MLRLRVPSFVIALGVLPWCLGCGSESGGAESAPAATSVAASSTAATSPPVMGSFEIDGAPLEFRVSRCDLTGEAPDGILLAGGGTLPDGRTFRVEVERLTPGTGGPGWPYERATVQYGGFTDEDGWEATASSTDGSRWTDGNGGRVIDGPIIQVSGNDLSVAATYEHASRDERLDGVLRATCPGTTYP